MIFTVSQLCSSSYKFINSFNNTGAKNSEIKYYKLNGIDYNLITLTNNENKVYKTGIYYILQDEKNNIYTISNDRFNANESYY